MDISTERKTITWLFNPFVYIAGAEALGLGLVAIILAGLIGYTSNTHFDGVLDTHTGRAAPLAFFLTEGFVDWLSLSFVLFVIGKLVSATSFRVIDVFGTQALARWPTIVMSLLTLAPPYHRFSQFLTRHIMTGESPATTFGTPDDIRGGRAIGSFIAGLFIAEIISKFAIFGLIQVAASR
jgi:hypothetical protein